MPVIQNLAGGFSPQAYQSSPLNLGQTPPEALPPNTGKLSAAQAKSALMGQISETLSKLPQTLTANYMKGQEIGAASVKNNLIEKAANGETLTPGQVAVLGMGKYPAAVVPPTALEQRKAEADIAYREAQTKAVTGKPPGGLVTNPLLPSIGGGGPSTGGGDGGALEDPVNPPLPTKAPEGGEAIPGLQGALADPALPSPDAANTGGAVVGALVGAGNEIPPTQEEVDLTAARMKQAGLVDPATGLPAVEGEAPAAAPQGALAAEPPGDPQAGRIIGKKKYPGFTRVETASEYIDYPDMTPPGGPFYKITAKPKPEATKETKGRIFESPEAARAANVNPAKGKFTNNPANPNEIAIEEVSDMPSSDYMDIANAIVDGTSPPTLAGRDTKATLAIKAELARRGFNLTNAALDWSAETKHVAALETQGQLKLRQSIKTTYHSLDILEQLAERWANYQLADGKYPILNRAQIRLAKNGSMGEAATTLATQLDAQRADMVAELATVLKAGNSPTNEVLKLAQHNLESDFTPQTFKDTIALIKQNLNMRANAMVEVESAREEAKRIKGETKSDAAPSSDGRKVVKTQAEYNSLQPGEKYVDSKGNPGTKK